MPDSASTIAYRSALEVIAASEPDIAAAIVDELHAQRRQLKFIASENYASPAVLLAMGNWLSDKYAEGIPGRRMYAGCEIVDRIETAGRRARPRPVRRPHAYVQPHSGIDANLVAYWAILARRVERPLPRRGRARPRQRSRPTRTWRQLRRQLGDQRMLGMSLDAGGHLTHGFRPNISRQNVRPGQLRRRPRHRLWTTTASPRRPAQFRPLILVAGYSAYPRRSTSPA